VALVTATSALFMGGRTQLLQLQSDTRKPQANTNLGKLRNRANTGRHGCCCSLLRVFPAVGRKFDFGWLQLAGLGDVPR
jgi:hypothetical protein